MKFNDQWIWVCWAESCVIRAHVNMLENIGQRFYYPYGARKAYEVAKEFAEKAADAAEQGDERWAARWASEVSQTAVQGYRRRAWMREAVKWQLETLKLYQELPL